MNKCKESMDLKAQGNEKYKAGKYEEAIQLYSEAIENDSQNQTLFSNRAMAHLKLGDAQAAKDDALNCIRLNPTFDKGYYRLGCALELQDKLEEALQQFYKAQELNQESPEISAKIKVIREKVKSIGGVYRRPTERAQGQSGWAREQMRSGGSSRIGGGGQGGGAWAQGFPSDKEKYEWLIDCYRMRADDDYVWGGGHLHGLYDCTGQSTSVAQDFLIFCKLAVYTGEIPANWNWQEFLDIAAAHLHYAFEKSDAQDKYGTENIFTAAMGAGRSLRFTAEGIYQSPCTDPGTGEEEIALQEELDLDYKGWNEFIREGIDGRGPHGPGGVFGEVGGTGAWAALENKIRLNMRNS